MLWHRSLLLILRQWAYAPEFRIPVYGPEDLSAALLAAFCQHEASAGAEQDEAREKDAPDVEASPTGAFEGTSDGQPAETGAATPLHPDEPLAVAICNGCFRIRRNALEMDATASDAGRNDGKEISSISRALDRMDEFLKERGIEYRDPTGQVYDPGRQDFQSIGEPEVVAGLTLPTIVQVERPAVLVNGTLVQCARGVVGKPAS